MLHRAFALLVVCLSSITSFCAQPKVQIMPQDQVKAGMHGVAYTVFEGVKPEPMDVEILGVLKDMAGPKADVILARLHGAKVEYTGVVAGMSGSPVYIDGKLVGAIAYRIGEFSKEPICGITPASNMLEIDALDKSAGDLAKAGSDSAKQVASPTSGPGLPNSATSAVSVREPAQAHRHASGIQRLQSRYAARLRQGFCLRGRCARDGRRLGQQRQAAGAAASRLGRQRNSGARRHEHRRNLHGHLYRRQSSAGLRTSAVAVGLASTCR